MVNVSAAVHRPSAADAGPVLPSHVAASLPVKTPPGPARLPDRAGEPRRRHPVAGIARAGLTVVDAVGALTAAPVKLLATPVLEGALLSLFCAAGGAHELGRGPAAWTAAAARGQAPPDERASTPAATRALARGVRLGLLVPLGAGVTLAAVAVGAVGGAAIGAGVGLVDGLLEGLDAIYQRRLPRPDRLLGP